MVASYSQSTGLLVMVNEKYVFMDLQYVQSASFWVKVYTKCVIVGKRYRQSA